MARISASRSRKLLAEGRPFHLLGGHQAAFVEQDQHLLVHKSLAERNAPAVVLQADIEVKELRGPGEVEASLPYLRMGMGRLMVVIHGGHPG